MRVKLFEVTVKLLEMMSARVGMLIELVEVIPEPSPMGTVLLQIAALIFIVLVVLFILWHQGHAFHGGKGHPHPSGDNKWHPPESKDWHGEH